MHRLKSPFVALLAILIAAGPIAGRITQTSPGDPYQISTPSAWERSRQETIPVAEPALRFSHGGITDESDLQRRYSIGDDMLLASPTKVSYLEVTTMSILWELEPSFEITGVSLLEGTDLPNIMVSGQTTCTLLDTQQRKVRWERPDCPSGSFTPRDDGLFIMHTFGSRDQATLRMLEAETGEERWSYSYAPNPNMGSYRNSLEGEFVYFFTASSVDAVSMDTGELLWTAPIVAEEGMILLESHLLVLRNEEIIALDPASGAEVWLSFVEPGYYTSSEQAQPETGEKLLLAMGSSVVVLDVTTGLEVARYEDASIQAVGYQDETGGSLFPAVFVLKIGDDAVGINWETLEEAWQITNSGTLSASQWAHNGVQLMSTEDDRLLLIDTQTGQTLLTVETADFDTANDGDIILFRFERRIEAYDTVSKRKLWTYAPSDELRRWNNTSDHVIVTTPYTVYVLDARTGKLVEERSHPDVWDSYYLTTRFTLYLNGSSVTAVHHITGTSTTLNEIYDFDLFQVSGSGEVVYFQYPDATMTLVDGSTGKRLYEGDDPIDMHSLDGGFALLTDETDRHRVRLVEPTGTVRWELDVPTEFTHIWYYPEETKILLRARTNALLIDADSGKIIMEIPIGYNPDGENDSLYISAAEAVAVGSNAETVVYQVPTPAIEQLVEETTVRGGPSSAGVERGTFPAGTPVFPTGNVRERSDGLWIEVRVEDVTGWIREDSVAGHVATPVATP